MNGLLELCLLAMRLDTIMELQSFLQNQSQGSYNKWLYAIALNIFKFKVSRFLLKIVLKSIRKLQIKL